MKKRNVQLALNVNATVDGPCFLAFSNRPLVAVVKKYTLNGKSFNSIQGENNKQQTVCLNGYVIIRNISQLKNFGRNIVSPSEKGRFES